MKLIRVAGNAMVNVAIIGASGYVGGELLRLLARHERVEEINAYSRQHAGRDYGEVHPQLSNPKGKFRLWENKVKEDVVFISAPHGTAMEIVPKLLEVARVIDMSADFRLSDHKLYGEWYKLKHKSPQLLSKTVYGLPELHREEIRKARLVANPGCYATGAILALAPLLRNGLVQNKGITIDSKSGVSGAGKELTEFLHSGEVIGNVKHYGLPYHRHVPEMEQELSGLTMKEIKVNFTPTLVPITRGILTTAKAFITSANEAKVYSAYRKLYGREPFIRIVENLPTVGGVVNTNYCDVSFRIDKRTNCIVAISAIDNLLKGAAGQAVQNMNIMLGFEERAGLN